MELQPSSLRKQYYYFALRYLDWRYPATSSKLPRCKLMNSIFGGRMLRKQLGIRGGWMVSKCKCDGYGALETDGTCLCFRWKIRHLPLRGFVWVRCWVSRWVAGDRRYWEWVCRKKYPTTDRKQLRVMRFCQSRPFSQMPGLEPKISWPHAISRIVIGGLDGGSYQRCSSGWLTGWGKYCAIFQYAIKWLEFI